MHPNPQAPPAIILDRDGTVIEEKHYLHDPDGVELIPGAAQALARCAQRGAKLYIASNQSGIGRGYYNEAAFHAVNARIAELLAPFGATFEEAACCPHIPAHGCDCRKPALGMWESLREKHRLDPQSTVMIGDKIADVAFGRNAGLYTVLVQTGHGPENFAKLGLALLPPEIPHRQIDDPKPEHPHLLAQSLVQAVDYLLTLDLFAETP